jgi:acyl-CoA synthetase (AMP-forming)/AMP-acid ligase II
LSDSKRAQLNISFFRLWGNRGGQSVFAQMRMIKSSTVGPMQTFSAIVEPFPGILDGRLGRTPRGSTGILTPGMEARIVRDNGSDAAPNERGELWLRGRNIALGYWQNEKATRETFVDGWLRTGDLFKVDEKGFFLYVVSR